MDDEKKKNSKNRVVTLTEDQELLWKDALHAMKSLGDALVDVGSPIREFALGLTKLQEAEMWVERGFDMLDIDVYEDKDDDEGDEDDDEDDEG
jgi:hypothetical protein